MLLPFVLSISVFFFPYRYENIGQYYNACLLDDNDDEPTGLFDFERKRKKKKMGVSRFASSGTNK
jgi:hypothetical protein